jgi:NAD(P)-dependent dehydrogenase (short-subunit alcohol dehydrogenase family)
MDAFFHGRVYAISGGASGIGLATAKALLRGGAKVSIGDVRVPDDLREELRTNTTTDKGLDDFVLLKTVDVRSRADVEGWIEETVGKFGQLDGAANLAGTIPQDHNVGTIETVRDEDWEFVMGVNVYGVMNCLRAEIKHMTGGGGGGGHGSIVNAGSGLSLEGRAGTSAYTASKHAVLGLTRCVAKEVGKRGVRVNCIAP